MNNYNDFFDFPAQKISESKKTDKWFEQCAEAGIKLADRIKNTNDHYRNKLSNYKLVNNIIDQKEMENALNPFKIKAKDLPVEYKNYPLITPLLNLLVGEESNMNYNYMVSAINHDAVTEKMEMQSQLFKQTLYKLIIKENLTQEEIQTELEKFEKYIKYDFKTSYETLGNQVLRYLDSTLDLKRVFNQGFMDFLISGDEIYVAEVINGEPILRKGSPLNFTFIINNNSYKIEDSDVIIEEVYLSKGSIIDKFNEYLTDAQIKQIESGFSTKSSNINMVDIPEISSKEILVIDNDLLYVDNNYLDQYGNIKVTRVVWAGFRKIGIVSFYNEEMELEKILVPENYIPDEERGEQVKWIWIKEWYETTKIGDFYIKKEPCAIQIRNMDNPSISNPGIVGNTLYSLSNGLVNSLVDDLKVLQYTYNLYMAKLELAIKKFKGRIGKLPLHLVPDDWDVDKWIYYAEYMGWAVEDAFAESNKPNFQGRPAGGFNQTSPYIDLSIGNEIQMYISMLEFIERRVEDISGINRQRKGGIYASETVGGVEHAVIQSSNITKRWFDMHNELRKRALRILVETAKISWRNKSFVKEYVLDFGTREFIKFNYNDYKMASYGVDIIDTNKEMAAMQAIRQLSTSIIQNGGTLSMIASLYRIDNLGELQRKIEEYEEQIEKSKQEQMQQMQIIEQQKIQQEQMKLQIQIEEKEKDRELEILKTRIASDTQIAIANIKNLSENVGIDLNNNNVPDPLEITKITQNKVDKEIKAYLKEKEIKLKEKEVDKKLSIEEEKLKLEKEKLKQNDKKIEIEKKLKEKELETLIKNKVPGEK